MYIPTNVIFGVTTFLAMDVAVAIVLVIVLGPPLAPVLLLLLADVLELPLAVFTTTGSVDGMGFPSIVCSFSTFIKEFMFSMVAQVQFVFI